MIFQAKSRKHIPDIIELVKNINVSDFKLEELRRYLEFFMKDKALLVLLDSEKRCFSISSVYRDLIIPYVAIMYAWSDPHYPELGNEEMQMIKDWAKSLNISVIRTLIHKNIEGYREKYGFKIDGILMKLEI